MQHPYATYTIIRRITSRTTNKRIEIACIRRRLDCIDRIMIENKPTEENMHNGIKYPSHIKAKLFTCKYCRKSFSHKSRLNDHIKSIHKKSSFLVNIVERNSLENEI